MITRRITSLQHPLVKKLVKIRESRAFREEEGTVLIAHRTVVQEVARHSTIKTLISTEPLSIPATTTELATEEVLQKIIGHKTDDLVAAEVMIPPAASLDSCDLVIVLDGLSDPGNVGTIFRTALALGWDGVFVVEGSSDPYNDKALRAARGAPLLLPWRTGSHSDLEIFIKKSKRQVIVADIQGEPLSKMKFSKPLALIVGHETRGPSEKSQSLGSAVTIPMKGEMESLNVASAASILLYQIHEVLR